MTRSSRFAWPAALLLAGVATATNIVGGGKAAEAKPPFAAKEGKPCNYCHVKPNGGDRNYRGLFYKAHNLTFEGFDDAAEAKKAGVEIGPEPTPPPKSQTPPAQAAAPRPAPMPAPAAGPSKAVVAARARLATAKAAYSKAPKNAAKKKAYAGALASLGHWTMLDTSMPVGQRYPVALRLARQALSLDPKNPTALKDKKEIEAAYRSLGRPIPK